MQPNTPLEPTPTPATPPAPAPTPTPEVPPTPSPFTMAADASPVPTPPAAPGSKKKLITILVIAGVVLLAGIGALLYFLLASNGSASPAAKISDAVTGKKEVIDRTDGTLDLSDTVQGSDDISDQTLTAKLNQQVNMKNGVSLMVTKVERNFTGFDSKYLTVKEGEEVVAVTLVAGSRNTEGNGIPNSTLQLQAPSGAEISPEFLSSLAKVEGKFDSGSGLDQGKQVSGRVLYTVMKAEAPLAFHYIAKYKKSGSDTTATLQATINLQ